MEKKRQISALLKVGILIVVLMLATAIVVFAREIQEAENRESAEQTAANAHGITVRVYYGDQNGEFIINKEAKVSSVTPQNLTALLIEQGILQEGTQALSLDVQNQDGKKMLQVDFNEAFRETLMNLGTSGERIFLGSVINTFLEAYRAEGILITVEGATLESGHNVYDRYQNFYGQVQQRMNITYSSSPHDQKTVEVLKIYSDLGFATVFDEQTFAHAEDLDNDEVLFYDLTDEEAEQNSAYMKITRFDQTLQSVISDIRAHRPEAELKSTNQAIGRDQESSMSLSYLEGHKEQNRRGEMYVCQHNNETYVIELNCEDQEENLWGQLQMMLDEFYFVD